MKNSKEIYLVVEPAKDLWKEPFSLIIYMDQANMRGKNMYGFD